jgi:hypothetical protein
MAFRQAAYECLGTARDALFELADAVLLMPHVGSLAEFSQCPVFRRRWPSVYEALQDGRPDRQALHELYQRQLPSARERLIFMGDHTAWSRPQAYTLRDRTVEHQPTRVPGAKPITVGQGYATLAWVPELSGSWALPVLHERLTSTDKPLTKAAAQLREVSAQVPGRALGLFDAEYGCAPFVQQTADIACDKLMRLRSNLVLYKAPSPYRGRGRPAVHGRKFKFHDARTWGKPVETLEVDEPIFGKLRIQLWAKVHFKKAPHTPLWIIRLERLAARGTRRAPRMLWLAWVGEPPPPLADLWPLYFRRYAGDHWYRFAKQSLHWTLPRCKTPEQAERWSDLMPLVTWELWLARPLVSDKPLPWQKPQAQLTPGRVRQSLAAVFAQIGTPAQKPKPRGKSPGWRTGRRRPKAARYSVVKKR